MPIPPTTIYNLITGNSIIITQQLVFIRKKECVIGSLKIKHSYRQEAKDIDMRAPPTSSS
jgi:hypothetical protein